MPKRLGTTALDGEFHLLWRESIKEEAMFAKTLEITESLIFMDKVETWGWGNDGLLTSFAME